MWNIIQRKALLTTPLAVTALIVAACSGGGSSPGNASGESVTNDPISLSSKLSVTDQAAPEGQTGDNPTLTFTIRLEPAAAATVTVNYTTQDDSATAASDYQASSNQLVFAPGETAKTVDITLIGDADDEDAEQFLLALSAAQGAEIEHGMAIGVIANDDIVCTTPATNADNPWFDRRIINFSHRGGALEYPENTMYSYLKSAEIGAEVLEMDIYETADGELVVIHDSSVDRTTDQSGDVSSFTLAELREMDAAYNFVPERGAVGDAQPEEYVFRGIATGDVPPPAGYQSSDFKIPTLEEILQRFPTHLINIELKPDTDSTGSYESKLADLLLRYGRQDNVIVASFLDSAAINFKAAAPCISTSFPTAQAAAYVSSGQGPSQMPGVSVHQAFQVPPSLGVEVVNQDFVDDAHAAGLAVHVWTINDCQQMVELLNLDVDAIMTDRPNVLEALLAQPEGDWSCDNLQ